jgi:hypothetical protein
MPLIGPVVGYGKATYTATVEIEVGARVLATDRVPPGATFPFSEPKGKYTLVVVGHRTCAPTPATVRSGRRTEAIIYCERPGMAAAG